MNDSPTSNIVGTIIKPIPLIIDFFLVFPFIIPSKDSKNKYPSKAPSELATISSISNILPPNNCKNSIQKDNKKPTRTTFLKSHLLLFNVRGIKNPKGIKSIKFNIIIKIELPTKRVGTLKN